MKRSFITDILLIITAWYIQYRYYFKLLKMGILHDILTHKYLHLQSRYAAITSLMSKLLKSHAVGLVPSPWEVPLLGLSPQIEI